MAVIPPVFRGAGAGVLTATSGAALTPGYDATPVAGDLLLGHVFYGANTAAPSTPSGWSLLSGPHDLGTPATNGRVWLFGRIAAGGDASPAFGTNAVTTPRRARVYRFDWVRNDTITNVVGGIAFETNNVATFPDVGVTTTEANSFAVNLVAQPEDIPALGPFTGETGGDWTELVAEFTGTTGTPDTSMQIQGAPMAAAGTIDGGTFASGTALNRGVIGFYLRGYETPAGAPTVEAHDTSIGLGTSAVVDRPGTQAECDGEQIIVVVNVEGGTNVSVSPPDGTWTLLDREDQTTNIGMATYVKTGGAAEPATYTFTLGLSAKWAAASVRVDGADAATVTALGGNGAPGNATAPSVTNSTVPATLLRFYGSKANSTWTPDPNATEKWDAPNSTDGAPSNMMAYGWQESGSSTGTSVAVPSVSAEWAAQTVVLTAPVVAPTFLPPLTVQQGAGVLGL